MASDRYFDGFIDFPRGINSGIAPISLPPNQLGFMINGTVRGGFASPRPPIVNRSITFDTPANQVLFENGLWQGAAYFKPDSGREGYVVQVAGNLFWLQLVGDTFQALNVTIPGEPNDPSLPFAWMWQSEAWMNINNGANAQIIFDGTTARRLDPIQETLGTTAADFIVPAVGATVDVTLAANFLGQINQHVLLSGTGAGYIVTDIGGSGSSNNATLTPTFSDGTTTYPAGTPLIVNPQVVSRLAVDFIINAGNYDNQGGQDFLLTSVNPPLGPTWTFPNNHTVVLKDQNGIDRTFLFEGRNTGDNGASFVIPISGTQPFQKFVAGTPVRLISAGTPTTIGTIEAAFTVPGLGVAGITNVLPQYNGPDISVFAGNSQFTLHAVPSAPTSVTVTLRNINDTEGDTEPTGTVLYSVPELPAGRMGAYGQGRNWISLPDGRSFLASDIVGNQLSGTAQYNFRDAVFHTTENMLLAGGGTFFVPGNIGNISAMSFSAILDQSLGQGPLNVFCPVSVFSCNAPVDRTKWQDLVTPILPEVLIGSGAASQWSVVQTNADIIFRAPDATVRSLLLARLDYHQWGNTPISYEVARIIQSENVSLMPHCSAIQFDNRMLMTCQPTARTNGVTFAGVLALNFDTISSLAEKSPSVWEGLWTGFDAFWIGNGRFNGVDRAFFFYNNNGKIGVKEMLPYSSLVQNDSNGPIPLQFETPVLFKSAKGKGYFDYCELFDGELYFSNLTENVDVVIDYKPDFYENWVNWRTFTIKVDPTMGNPQYRTRIGLGTPSVVPRVDYLNKPTRLGRWFQFRISMTGGRPLFNGCKISAVEAPQPDFAPVHPCD